MTLYVRSIPDAAGILQEAISPELVLVDPELSRAARSRLPDPGAEASRRRDRDVRSVRVPSPAWVPDELPELAGQQTSRRLLVGVAAVTMLALLVFDVRVEVGEAPASATEALETAAPEPPAVSLPAKPRSANTAPPSRSRPAPTVRRFAWAPTARASGYYIEFFRGGTRVYARESTRPTIEIPARWRYEGVERSFRPGTYRWYVWPVVGGQRTTRAVVQTTLSIPRS